MGRHEIGESLRPAGPALPCALPYLKHINKEILLQDGMGGADYQSRQARVFMMIDSYSVESKYHTGQRHHQCAVVLASEF